MASFTATVAAQSQPSLSYIPEVLGQSSGLRKSAVTKESYTRTEAQENEVID